MIEYSIIIPVFNSIDYTKNCIRSIYDVSEKNQVRYKYEIIVIDNNSSDNTGIFLKECKKKYSNFKYIVNDENFGFAKACNIGAKNANGEYLIFLNNDTQVLIDWDKYLLETIRKNSDIWIVGSKCLYEDNTIQHAGVVFGYDKVPFHIYRTFPKDFGPANIELECKCVTAACLIIKTDNFLTLGGFDEIYVNGMEDVDLCLKISSKGKKIVYQPKSVIKHYESKTIGRFNQVSQNRKIFFERWGNYIIPDVVMHYEKTGAITAVGGNKQLLHILKDHPLYHISLEISPNLKMKKFYYEEIIKKEAKLKKKEDELKKIYASTAWKILKKMENAVKKIRHIYFRIVQKTT